MPNTRHQRGRPRVLNAPVRATTSIDQADNAVLLQYIRAGKARTISEAIRAAVAHAVRSGTFA